MKTLLIWGLIITVVAVAYRTGYKARQIEEMEEKIAKGNKQPCLLGGRNEM